VYITARSQSVFSKLFHKIPESSSVINKQLVFMEYIVLAAATLGAVLVWVAYTYHAARRRREALLSDPEFASRLIGNKERV
jgi:hypothetical protein